LIKHPVIRQNSKASSTSTELTKKLNSFELLVRKVVMITSQGCRSNNAFVITNLHVGAAGRVAIGAGIGSITTVVVHDYVAVCKLV
jgi:hypothetical protein